MMPGIIIVQPAAKEHFSFDLVGTSPRGYKQFVLRHESPKRCGSGVDKRWLFPIMGGGEDDYLMKLVLDVRWALESIRCSDRGSC
jgi:hypothetical protein